jgi:putative two-component system response regulator
MRILVIDDDRQIADFVRFALKEEGYVIDIALTGAHGLELAASDDYDAIILDVVLPDTTGIRIARDLRERARTTPILMLTARNRTEDVVSGLDAGADDYLAKPFQQAELFARMRSAFRLRQAMTSLERATQIVASLANAVEAKDVGLVHHCRWLAHHEARVAAKVGLRGDELEAVAYGALLHDVGKIGVPEHLLRKEGPLSPDEWTLMRRHPEIGERICHPLSASRAFAPIIRHHHERFDGTGYPDGLRADQIPLGARIVTVTDAYEAIVHGRPYQPAQPHDAAAEELLRLGGKQFDPELVPVFLDELERDGRGLPPIVELPPAALLEPELAPGP